jgi:hypothetical protein
MKIFLLITLLGAFTACLPRLDQSPEVVYEGTANELRQAIKAIGDTLSWDGGKTVGFVTMFDSRKEFQLRQEFVMVAVWRVVEEAPGQTRVRVSFSLQTVSIHRVIAEWFRQLDLRFRRL